MHHQKISDDHQKNLWLMKTKILVCGWISEHPFKASIAPGNVGCIVIPSFHWAVIWCPHSCHSAFWGSEWLWALLPFKERSLLATGGALEWFFSWTLYRMTISMTLYLVRGSFQLISKPKKMTHTHTPYFLAILKENQCLISFLRKFPPSFLSRSQHTMWNESQGIVLQCSC